MNKLETLQNFLTLFNSPNQSSCRSIDLVNNNLMRKTNKNTTTNTFNTKLNLSNKLGPASQNKQRASNSNKQQTNQKSKHINNFVLETNSIENSPNNISSKNKNKSNKKNNNNSILNIIQNDDLLIHQLFGLKCQKLSIPLIKEKYCVFLNNFIKKNKNYKNLNFINFSGMHIEGCQQIINKFLSPKVIEVNLQKNNISLTLLNLKYIKKLNLNNCNLGNEQLIILFDMLISQNRIKSLSLSSPQIESKNYLTQYDKLYQFIQKCTNLQQLRLSNIGLKKDTEIFTYLKNSSLKILDLSHNEGVIGICPNLQQLNLSNNKLISAWQLVPSDIKAKKSDIRILNLSYNPIAYHQLQRFLKSSYFTSLRQLNLSKLQLNGDCMALQQFLGLSVHLNKLIIIDCDLVQESWRNIIIGLRSNNSIQQVYLDKNSMINQNVAQDFGEIFTSTNIKRLSMSLCNIKDRYGPLLCKYMAKNKSLQYLNFSQNKMSSLSGATLLSVLKFNYGIKTLNLLQNCINYTVQKDLTGYINRNRYLQIKNIKKEYYSLTKVQNQDIELAKYQQLKDLQENLHKAKQDKQRLQQESYKLKCSRVNEQTTTIKKSIRNIRQIENSLMSEIQKIQQDIYDDSLRQHLNTQSQQPVSNLVTQENQVKQNPEKVKKHKKKNVSANKKK